MKVNFQAAILATLISICSSMSACELLEPKQLNQAETCVIDSKTEKTTLASTLVSYLPPLYTDWNELVSLDDTNAQSNISDTPVLTQIIPESELVAANKSLALANCFLGAVSRMKNPISMNILPNVQINVHFGPVGYLQNGVVIGIVGGVGVGAVIGSAGGIGNGICYRQR